MRTFALKLLAFVSPFLVLLGVPLLVMATSGELTGVDRALAHQARGADILYGPAYTNPVKHYKLRGAQRRRPQILALGSSRVMQFSETFFNEPDRFYNAGGAMATVWDARHFLDALTTDERPRVIILGVDQWFLNPRWASGADTGAHELTVEDTALNIVQRNWRRLYTDLRRHKIDLARALADTSGIGIAAVMRRMGFRRDGSYYYGDCVETPESCEHWDRGFEDTFGRIARGDLRFEWSDTVDEAAAAEVERLLDFAAAAGIQVVAVLPPFAPSVLARMRASGKYGYLDLVAPRLAPAFRRHGMVLLDLTDPASLAAGDEEFIDGFHGSTRTYLRILLRLADADAELRARARSPTTLRQQLASAGRYEVPAGR